MAPYVWSVEKSNIETTVGKTFTIVLPENPTTGYTWFWAVGDEVAKRTVELIRKEFLAKQPIMAGSGGTVKFTFKAMHKGTTPIVLTLKRIWEMNSDSDQKRFDVIVHPKKHKKAKK
jgi:Predicted secreted protein